MATQDMCDEARQGPNRGNRGNPTAIPRPSDSIATAFRQPPVVPAPCPCSRPIMMIIGRGGLNRILCREESQ